MLRLVLTTSALTLSIACAGAQTDKQKSVMNLLAQAVALDEICPNVSQNTERMLLILLANKIDIEEKRFYNYMSSQVEQRKSEYRARGQDIACAVAPFVFGPGGSGVPDLLRIR